MNLTSRCATAGSGPRNGAGAALRGAFHANGKARVGVEAVREDHPLAHCCRAITSLPSKAAGIATTRGDPWAWRGARRHRRGDSVGFNRLAQLL